MADSGPLAGYRMRVFGMFVLFLIMGTLVGFAAGLLNRLLPQVEIVPAASGSRVVFNYGNYAIQTAVAALLNILVETYAAICWTLFYFDLRIRKEGFDLELAARQQATTS